MKWNSASSKEIRKDMARRLLVNNHLVECNSVQRWKCSNDLDCGDCYVEDLCNVVGCVLYYWDISHLKEEHPEFFI